MTLSEVLAEIAGEIDGVDVTSTAGGTTEYRLSGQLIAVAVSDGVGEFRLDPAVAAAARRTPDTDASDRGPDWVRFAPVTLDDHAEDRAVAWLESAARHAAG